MIRIRTVSVRVIVVFMLLSLNVMAVEKSAEVRGLTDSKLRDYCARFQLASIDKNIKVLLSTIGDDGYSAEDIFSKTECPPDMLNKIKHKVPMIQLAAEKVFDRSTFPQEIYEYFQWQKSPESWLKIVNAKNTMGMTYLDYVKFNYEKIKTVIQGDERAKFQNMYAFACSHGGEFSYYKEQTCSDGL